MSRHLIYLDGSKAAEQALPHALASARAFDADLHLLHVLERDALATPGAVDSVTWRMRRAEASAYLEGWGRRMEAKGVRVTTELREGRAREEVLDAARSLDVDLLVVASEGGGRSDARRGNPGDAALEALSSGGISVLNVVSRPGVPPVDLDDPAPPYRRILAPLDASPRAEVALRVASALARHHGATLVLAHVAPVPELPGAAVPTAEDERLRGLVVARNRRRGDDYLEALRSRLSDGNVAVETRTLVSTDVGRAVCRAVREDDIDLVVACAHGGGCSRFGEPAAYGSVARALLRDGSAPVWMLQDLPVRANAVPRPERPVAASRPPGSEAVSSA